MSDAIYQFWVRSPAGAGFGGKLRGTCPKDVEEKARKYHAIPPQWSVTVDPEPVWRPKHEIEKSNLR
jgi:hypothetical protein